MDIPLHPTFNTALNATAAVLLWLGRRAILRGDAARHKALMVSALAVSAAFLTSYLIYHSQGHQNPYPHGGWRRGLYFAILIPHIALAGLMVPFIAAVAIFAFRGRFDRHRALARWVWPVWMYVSVTGVLVYLMLYIFV